MKKNDSNSKQPETMANMNDNEEIKVEELLEKYDKESAYRKDLKFWGIVVAFLGISLTVFHLYTGMFGVLPPQKQRSIHLGIALFMIFLLYPAKKSGLKKGTIPWYDIVLGVLGMGVAFYHVFFYAELIQRTGAFITQDYVVATIGVILVLEATRRAVGTPIVVVASAALLYAYFGSYMPGFLSHRGFSFERIVSHSFLSLEGIMGIPLGISATFIFLFLFFGVMLRKTGIGQFFNDLAFALTGRAVGGPAKAAVIASAMQGTVTGSSVANTVGSGSFTIPLMKSRGYKPEFAAATEASASTGGQLMPPIMGAAAFIMIEFTGIDYLSIAAAAAIPAFLYFTGIFLSVHLESKKEGLYGLPKSELPVLKDLILQKGYLFLPLVVIVYILVSGQTPMRAAMWGILATFVVSFFKKESRMNLREMLKTLEDGARTALPVIAACATAGIIVGVVTLTGLGMKVAGGIIGLAGGNLILTLFFTMIACIVLGMGLPTTANYVVTATMAAPALLELGVPVIAAHLFVFYFGIVADITPPVALAAYAGSGVAGSNPFKTSLTAVKIAIAAFLIPYIFALSPVLVLVDATPVTVIIALATAFVGMIGISSGSIGYLARKALLWERFALFIGGLLMIYPEYVLQTDIAGAALIIVAYLNQRRRPKEGPSTDFGQNLYS
ncbi:TRAP transporter 4TM/12TM fusion protein [Desulfitispora alkaliphila]|uniref:TRAP transporter permease n=1 Tax=Desulfitispora alkaliphila TaxID=622674 RepID=UPI003D1A6756